MTDIPISVSAPGASKAAAELRGVATATERAGQAAGVNATQQARQTRELEKAAAAAKKANNEMRGAATRGLAAGGAGRIGGAIGGGVAAMGMTSGLGAAGMAVGAVISVGNALATFAKRNIDSYRITAEASAELAKSLTAARRSLSTNALQWGDANGETAKSIIAMGGEGAMSQVRFLKSRGVLGADKGMLAALEAGRADNSTLTAAEVASKTGIVSFEEAVKLAVEHGIDSAAGILSAKTNRVVTNEDLERMQGNISGSKLAKTVDIVSGIRGNKELALENGFISKGIKAAEDESSGLLHPELKAMSDLNKTVNDQLIILQEQLEKMSIWETLVDRLSYDSSVAKKYNDAADRAAALNGIPVP